MSSSAGHEVATPSGSEGERMNSSFTLKGGTANILPTMPLRVDIGSDLGMYFVMAGADGGMNSISSKLAMHSIEEGGGGKPMSFDRRVLSVSLWRSMAGLPCTTFSPH